MKILRYLYTLLILVTISTTSYGFTNNSDFNNSYRSTSVYISPSRSGATYGNPVQQTYGTPRIGYSTYQGNCRPTYNSNLGGRPGIRKVKGYDSNGNVIGDDTSEDHYSILNGNISFWSDQGYIYYWDEDEGKWYRTDGSGNYWEWSEYSGFWSWLRTYYNWHSTDGIPSGAIQGYQENPAPIEDPDIVIILVLLLLYIGYDILVKSKLKK